MLDTSHGADYFRRWHREKDKSGGLLVHKSTHHFDLVNWWLASSPKTVFAMGGLRFYGRENAEGRGVTLAVAGWRLRRLDDALRVTEPGLPAELLVARDQRLLSLVVTPPSDGAGGAGGVTLGLASKPGVAERALRKAWLSS